jgi:phosphoserine phosphatase RsbU/P
VLSGSCCWDARVEAVIVARMVLVRHAAPLAVLVTVAAVDVIAGRDQVVLGLVVIAPLVAANMLGRGATVGYGVLALFVAALLGVYDQQYNADTVVAQLVRLVGVALGAGAALVGCGLRLQREAELAVQERARTADLPVRRLAETLQRSLLTDPPALPGLQLVVRYRPASVDVLSVGTGTTPSRVPTAPSWP